MYSSLSLLGFVLGLGQQPVQPRGDEDLVGRAGWPGDFRQAVEFLFEPRAQRLDVHAGARQNGSRQPPFLLEQAREQVLYVDLLMAKPGGFGLRRPDRLLEFFRETIDVHIYILDLNCSAELAACRRSLRHMDAPRRVARFCGQVGARKPYPT